MKPIKFGLCFVLLAAGCEANRNPPAAAVPADAPTVAAERADNSGVNVRDRDATAKTPLSQGENKSDIGITADIRRRVVDSKMSTYASNVKIVTEGGQVVLRGPVASEEEKSRIDKIAVRVAGEGNVDNRIEVAKTAD